MARPIEAGYFHFPWLPPGRRARRFRTYLGLSPRLLPSKGDAMPSLRALIPLAAATGLMAAMPAGALAAPPHNAAAHAAGGEATALIYPSIVQTRLVRAQSALDKAAKYSDLGMPAKAITSLTAARNNLSKAWKGAKYV